MASTSGHIRVGVGGWTFEPWRGTFFPPSLPKTKELHHASRALDTLEINGTYYSLQSPNTFAKWRDETPDGFVFTVKAHRLTTAKKHLGDAGESIARFLGSGLVELRDKLGPILWQLPHFKRFDAGEVEAFVRLLPKELAGRPLQHVLDVRHESFVTRAYVDLARKHDIATVFTDSPEHPSFADITGPIIYARLMRTRSELPEGCEPEAFGPLSACARRWATGGVPDGVPLVDTTSSPASSARDVYAFFISGAKERAPMAAMALKKALVAGAAA
jgi:uncharacterized protein YecE (DUF72 family)